uniref:Uncharacterized protein n=1 Tax=Anguilla anguilla TaxID=7936 RepID=A0A0E9XM70_ANGAN
MNNSFFLSAHKFVTYHKARHISDKLHLKR